MTLDIPCRGKYSIATPLTFSLSAPLTRELRTDGALLPCSATRFCECMYSYWTSACPPRDACLLRVVRRGTEGVPKMDYC